MDKDAIEARVGCLFKEAKPRFQPKNHYLKLATVIILATIPLSVTQTPSSTKIPDPQIKPSFLAETDEALDITINHPRTIFFCDFAHTHSKEIDAFAPPNKPSDI